MTEDPAVTCQVCHRGDPPVCDRCRRRIRDQLAGLPELYGRLTLALIPGPGGGERVTSAQGEAPMPVRLAALALEAGGSAAAMADVHGAGVLPVREWLRAWVADWRHTLGHGTRAALTHLEHDAPHPDRHLSAAQLGITAAVQPADRPADPVALEWADRWPAHGWGPASHFRHRYLATWLPEACDRLPHIGVFAAGLRTLTGALRAALGDTDDSEYLGRCPEELEDRTTGVTTVCGAALQHDPYASVIICPRCHTETGQDQRVFLARRILEAWPIDRRRRYPRGLIDTLRLPTCPTCSAPVVVEWIDAIERADREPYWRPGSLSCTNACEVTL